MIEYTTVQVWTSQEGGYDKEQLAAERCAAGLVGKLGSVDPKPGAGSAMGGSVDSKWHQ